MLEKLGLNARKTWARKTENNPPNIILAGSQYKKAPFCLLPSAGCHRRRPSSSPSPVHPPASSSPPPPFDFLLTGAICSTSSSHRETTTVARSVLPQVVVVFTDKLLPDVKPQLPDHEPLPPDLLLPITTAPLSSNSWHRHRHLTTNVKAMGHLFSLENARELRFITLRR
jgi:hypothetical protein